LTDTRLIRAARYDLMVIPGRYGGVWRYMAVVSYATDGVAGEWDKAGQVVMRHPCPFKLLRWVHLWALWHLRKLPPTCNQCGAIAVPGGLAYWCPKCQEAA
jgi:hypothetical protein